jgi:hypothetical protein
MMMRALMIATGLMRPRVTIRTWMPKTWTAIGADETPEEMEAPSGLEPEPLV